MIQELLTIYPLDFFILFRKSVMSNVLCKTKIAASMVFELIFKSRALSYFSS